MVTDKRGRAGTGVPRRITNRHDRVQLPAAHEVTPADTVEVTACGENRLPAAGTHTPPGVIPAPRAHITGGEDGRQPTRSADTKTAPGSRPGSAQRKGVGT